MAYLTDLEKKFDGSWALAAAAYNRGENGLARDLTAQPGVATYWDAWLNDETARYVYRIMAIKYLMKAGPSLFERWEMLGENAGTAADLKLAGPVDDLAAWAAGKGLSYAQLRELNPWILGNRLPAGDWTLRTLAP